MANKSLKLSVQIEGLDAALRALNKLPDAAKGHIKDAAFELSQDMATNIRAAARGRGAQAGLMASTVSTGSSSGSDSIMPVVTIGGSSRVGRHGTAAYKILFGSEFGSVEYHQFPARNTAGYWAYPTVRAMQPEISERWGVAADETVEAFGDGA